MLGLPLGRLPGDLAVKRDNFSFYFPITTSIILSILITVILAFFGGDNRCPSNPILGSLAWRASTG